MRDDQEALDRVRRDGLPDSAGMALMLLASCEPGQPPSVSMVTMQKMSSWFVDDVLSVLILSMEWLAQRAAEVPLAQRSALWQPDVAELDEVLGARRHTKMTAEAAELANAVGQRQFAAVPTLAARYADNWGGVGVYRFALMVAALVPRESEEVEVLALNALGDALRRMGPVR